MYNLNYIKLYHAPKDHYYIDICDFDYNIAIKYLEWFHGEHKIVKVLKNEKVDKIKSHNIYQMIMPSLFFNSIHLSNTDYTFKSINYNLIQVFDEKHFDKLFNYWKQTYVDVKIHCDIVEHLKQNYKKYINEATIKTIIE